jgi:histidine ammonia-lyase
MEDLYLGEELEIHQINRFIENNVQIRLNNDSIQKITKCRKLLEEKLKEKKPIYGVSTGFGHLANKFISSDMIKILQVNLIRSHAAGTGEENPKEITKLAMLLLGNSLAKGYSGIKQETLELLLDFINYDLIPVTYKIGSLGASGDLAPLAHVALALIGEGEVYYNNNKLPTTEVLSELGLSPIELDAKEGLALINGTHFITAYAFYILKLTRELIDHNIIGSILSTEALRGTNTAFDKRISEIRQQPGQILVAEKLYKLMEGSEILQSHKEVEVDHKVQDPYSIRCIPQVLGAIYDTTVYLEKVLTHELNAVTDNPLIFQNDGDILSGGNFHAEPLGFPLETVNMALIEMANITERRIDRLLHPNTPELPSFLAKNPGVESGYMIPHYTSAAILNRVRVLAHPALTDNTPVSGSQEDHVSMAMGSAVKTYETLNLVQEIIALEIYLATRGLNMQNRPKSSNIIEKIITLINNEIEYTLADHYVRPKMQQATNLLRSNKILDLLD